MRLNWTQWPDLKLAQLTYLGHLSPGKQQKGLSDSDTPALPLTFCLHEVSADEPHEAGKNTDTRSFSASGMATFYMDCRYRLIFWLVSMKLGSLKAPWRVNSNNFGDPPIYSQQALINSARLNISWRWAYWVNCCKMQYRSPNLWSDRSDVEVTFYKDLQLTQANFHTRACTYSWMIFLTDIWASQRDES